MSRAWFVFAQAACLSMAGLSVTCLFPASTLGAPAGRGRSSTPEATPKTPSETDTSGRTSTAAVMGGGKPSGGRKDSEGTDEARLRAMRERLDEAFAASEGRPPSTDLESMRSAPSMASQALKTVVVLGGVCMLAYLLLGRLLPRLLRVPTPIAPRHIIQVVDRLPVDQKRSVMVLKLHDLHFLVGITEHGISLLSRLEAEDVRAAIETAGETSRGTGLRGWIGRRPEKET